MLHFAKLPLKNPSPSIWLTHDETLSPGARKVFTVNYDGQSSLNNQVLSVLGSLSTTPAYNIVFRTVDRSAPTIAGVTARTMNDIQTVSPFSGVTVTDVDVTGQHRVTVGIGNTANGTFSALAGFTSQGGGEYLFVGTNAQANAALQKLRVDGEALCFDAEGEAVALALGDKEAGKWLAKLQAPPPTLAAKLGVSADNPALLIGPTVGTLDPALAEALSHVMQAKRGRRLGSAELGHRSLPTRLRDAAMRLLLPYV